MASCELDIPFLNQLSNPSQILPFDANTNEPNAKEKTARPRLSPQQAEVMGRLFETDINTIAGLLHHLGYRKSQEELMDLVTEVFTDMSESIAKNGNQFTHHYEALKYLKDTAASTYIDLSRRERALKRRPTEELQSLEKLKQENPELEAKSEALDTNPEEKAILEDQQRRTRKALSHIDSEEQDLMVAHFVHGFSYKELARVYSTSIGHIRAVLKRATKHLGDQLGYEGIKDESDTTLSAA